MAARAMVRLRDLAKQPFGYFAVSCHEVNHAKVREHGHEPGDGSFGAVRRDFGPGVKVFDVAHFGITAAGQDIS